MLGLFPFDRNGKFCRYQWGLSLSVTLIVSTVAYACYFIFFVPIFGFPGLLVLGNGIVIQLTAVLPPCIHVYSCMRYRRKFEDILVFIGKNSGRHYHIIYTTGLLSLMMFCVKMELVLYTGFSKVYIMWMISVDVLSIMGLAIILEVNVIIEHLSLKMKYLKMKLKVCYPLSKILEERDKLFELASTTNVFFSPQMLFLTGQIFGYSVQCLAFLFVQIKNKQCVGWFVYLCYNNFVISTVKMCTLFYMTSGEKFNREVRTIPMYSITVFL